MVKGSGLGFFSFLLAVLVLSSPSLAQSLDFYSVEAVLKEDGISDVGLVLFFSEPVGSFDILLPFSVTDLNVTSSSGPVSCENQLGEVSQLSCNVGLTYERRTVEIFFQSDDLVKRLDGNFLFTADFSPKIPITESLIAVRLPGGMVLSEGVAGGSTVPFTNSTSTDGRRITIIWRSDSIDGNLPSVQVFYEPGIVIGEPNQTLPTLRLIALLLIVLGAIIAFIFLKRRQKPVKEEKEVILSVLDDYEKRVVSAIEKLGGQINQKRVVDETNLSKAKVSRVVQKLVERGVLHSERRGRTNIVKFVKSDQKPKETEEDKK